jgi:hypothetical protein
MMSTRDHRAVAPYKRRAYEAARQMRRQGIPIKRIAKRLRVSPSSVLSWTKDIILTPEQRERNQRGPHGPQNPARIAARVEKVRAAHRERRRSWQAEGRAAARRGDPLHLAGCMLYWAEGTKNRNSIRLANSDRDLMCFFVRFLREAMGVTDKQISLRLNVYITNGLSLRQIEDHWLWALELPRTALRKHQLNHKPTSSSGKKRNKLPYGVCTISVHSTHLVQHIYGAIQEYGGFEEPRWLDGPPRRSQARRPYEAP